MSLHNLTGASERTVVGIANLAVSQNPCTALAAYSLGSCLGVAIYDPVARVGGLLHAMLPDSNIDREKAAGKPGMFVDTGLPALFQAVIGLGAEEGRLRVSVAGAAQIMDDSSHFSIGRRNIEAFKAFLGQRRLKVFAADVGGLPNRTLFLDLATGEASLQVCGRPRAIPICKNSTIL
jgi:chemotaxis protein CheD